MLLLIIAFLGLMLLISFSTSFISAVWNEKLLLLSKVFVLKEKIDGITFSVGSVKSSVVLLVIKIFLLVFNVDPTFLKN